ncbi:MAG: hypothetical protein ACRD92_02755 [Nitrosopumilaceae archaeon]
MEKDRTSTVFCSKGKKSEPVRSLEKNEVGSSFVMIGREPTSPFY